MIPSIVLLGNLLVDDVVFADGTTRMAQPGGALLYGALGATLWDTHPGLVSVLGNDYPEEVLDKLQQRGADLSGVHPLHRPGVRTWLLYEGQVRRLIHRMGCPTHEEVSPQPSYIPPEWHAARAFHLAPMPFRVQGGLLSALRTGRSGRSGREFQPEKSGRAFQRRRPFKSGEFVLPLPDLPDLPVLDPFVSIDPHEPVTEQNLRQWQEVLAEADAFLPGEDELLLDEARSDPMRALPRLVHGRLRFVAFKRGAKGGILYDAHDNRFYRWDARTDVLVDQTGAGDAFGVGFALAHLEGLPIEACLQRAVVTASFAIAGWGPEVLLTATRGDADARLRAWYGDEERP